MERAATPTRADTALEDRALMARVRDDADESAFAVLMSRWELPTKAVVARIVLNAGEAEELAQETFVRVWQHRGKYRVGEEFRPWLFAIAVNLARNRLRWWRRRPAVALDDWSESLPGERRAVAAPGVPVEAPVGAAALERRPHAER